MCLVVHAAIQVDQSSRPCLLTDDSSQSTSFSLISAGTFSIQYGTAGSNVTGDSFTDDVQIGDNPITIKGLQMAVATQATNVPLGIMGIGFDTFEAVAGQGGQPYLNLPDALVNEGLINTRAYSLYLDDQGTSPHPHGFLQVAKQ